MRFFLTFFFMATVIYAAWGSPSDVQQQSLIIRQRRDLEIFSNTRLLIQKLAEDLRKAATDALAAVQTFQVGLLEQAKLIREKCEENVRKLQERVMTAIQSVVDKITGTGEAVKTCVNSHRKNANALFNDTIAKTIDCADERISEFSAQIETLRNMSEYALAFANDAIGDMQKCVDDNPGNILSVGSCLGGVALRTEVKGASYIAESVFSVARLNLELATLPAAMEVCAGTHLVEAGLGTARIVMEIGGCSASSIFTNFVGNNL